MTVALAFLGTGTCHATYRNPPALALADGSGVVLVDAGGGSYHQLRRVPDSRFARPIEAVLLTHYHVDHVSGLPDLIWGEWHGPGGPRRDDLVVVGPRGLGAFLDERLLAFVGRRDLPFCLRAVELAPGDEYRHRWFTARAHAMDHGAPALGYRLDIAGYRLAVTGDTGPRGDLAGLMAGADAAVMEWALAPGMEHPRHLGAPDIQALEGAGWLPPQVYAVHCYYAPGVSFEEQAQRNLQSIEGNRERFRFPVDGEVVTLVS